MVYGTLPTTIHRALPAYTPLHLDYDSTIVTNSNQFNILHHTFAVPNSFYFRLSPTATILYHGSSSKERDSLFLSAPPLIITVPAEIGILD